MPTPTNTFRRSFHAFLSGTLDPDSPLAELRGQSLVLCQIFESFSALEFEEALFAFDCDVAPPSAATWSLRDIVCFPKFTGIDVNMMPFELFDLYGSLPEELHGYIPMIRRCPVDKYTTYVSHEIIGDIEDWGVTKKTPIAYLTIHESEVAPGRPQRRPGLHVERPNALVAKNGGRIVSPSSSSAGDEEYSQIVWGTGYLDPVSRSMPVDGIWVASNVAGTTAVWPCIVGKPERVTDAHGGLDPAVVAVALKKLGQREKKDAKRPRTLQAGELCWITDRTPHESLPMSAETSGRRQFFRLVVGRVTVWYAKHNTPNPLGVQPDALIVDCDKFS